MVKRGVTEFLKALNSDEQKLVEIETDLMVTVDQSGNIIRVNPAFETALHRPERDVLRRHFIIYIYPKDIDAFLQAFVNPLPSEMFGLLRAEHGTLPVRLVAYAFHNTPQGQHGVFIFRQAVVHESRADWERQANWSG